MKLFLRNKILSQIDKPERELNKFICKNWKVLFPNYDLIATEFRLKGKVRDSGDESGRIDILGFNPETRKLIIFELKKDRDKYCTEQASDYRDFIQKNFLAIYRYLKANYKKIKLPECERMNETSEIILIAKKFSNVQVSKAERDKITLIKYLLFKNDLTLFDYLTNDPDNGKRKIADWK